MARQEVLIVFLHSLESAPDEALGLLLKLF